MRHTKVSLSRIGWLTVATLLTFAACDPGATSATVRLSGFVFSDITTDLACDEYTDPSQRPEELSGIELLFEDAEGNSLGTTTTGALERQDLDYGCRFSAAYEIVLDRAESFTVDFDPPEPRNFGGLYYDGANTLEGQTVDYQTIVDNGLTWNFEAPPQWVTP